MKTIKELSIKGMPWIANDERVHVTAKVPYTIAGRGAMIGAKEWVGVSRLICASPELYECLRDAVVEVCHTCTSCGSSEDGYACHADEGRECFVRKWRSALAAASGESEVNR